MVPAIIDQELELRLINWGRVFGGTGGGPRRGKSPTLIVMEHMQRYHGGGEMPTAVAAAPGESSALIIPADYADALVVDAALHKLRTSQRHILIYRYGYPRGDDARWLSRRMALPFSMLSIKITEAARALSCHLTTAGNCDIKRHNLA